LGAWDKSRQLFANGAVVRRSPIILILNQNEHFGNVLLEMKIHAVRQRPNSRAESDNAFVAGNDVVP
jgi:hypothetical protein